MTTGNQTKRVVLLGADFAPSSLPPALRLRFFAQHLSEFGWHPTVLTTDPAYYDWSTDAENEHLVPDGVPVIRTSALPAGLTRRLGIGDIGIRSMWEHWKVLWRLCREANVDVLFIAIPPYVPAILGRVVHSLFHIPYVIDYIDPWVNDYYLTVPASERPGGAKWIWWNRIATILEPFALRSVAHLTSVASGYLDETITRYRWLSPTDVTSIPYGGAPSDFQYLRQHPRVNQIFDPSDGCLHVSYVGRGGPDMLPVLRVLFAAVRKGVETCPALFMRLRLHFVGTTYSPNGEQDYQVLPLARAMGLQTFVDEHPKRVSYLDALQTLTDSHGLIAVGSELPYYTASKIFPFILSRRPILAIFHRDSSVVPIVTETEAGAVVTFGDIEDLGRRVDEVMEELSALLRFPPDYEPPTQWDAFERYTARSMARALAAVLDEVIERGAS